MRGGVVYKKTITELMPISGMSFSAFSGNPDLKPFWPLCLLRLSHGLLLGVYCYVSECS